MANSEHTFIAVKPDGVQAGGGGLEGEIIKCFEQKGFRLVGLKFMQASEDLLKEITLLYGLVKYMHSGPVVAMVWKGLNIVKTGRVMPGETNPGDSKNIIYRSNSVESAEEISLWFQPEELVDYKSCAQNWIYE
uniref:Nucleoside diphosphate kinase A n=1 Tax=Nannospalax galili TaxID=1026970 RepID=A0A8C6RJ78_NANGA